MRGLLLGADSAGLADQRVAVDPSAAAEPRRIRARDALGAWVAIGCLGGLIAYLALRHGLSVSVGLRALVGLYVLGIVPGHVIQRHVFGLRAGTPFEALLSSLLLGTVLTPFLWFTLCWLGLSVVFYPLMFALGLGVPLACGWHHQAAIRIRQLVTASDAPLLVLVLGLVVLWSWRLSPLVTMGDGQVTIQPHVDHLLHTTLIAELSRGVPAGAIPFIAGPNKWAYHHMPDVWCDMIRRVAGTDARTAYFFLALPLCYALVSFACYLGLVRRFGRAAAVAGVACMLGVVGYPDSWILLTNWLLEYLGESYPTAFGLVFSFLILYYASLTTWERPRRPLLLISLLSVALLWYKANLALAVAPAVAVLCAAILIRARDYRWLVLCLGGQASLAGLRLVQLSSAEFGPTLVMAPVAFLSHQWDIMRVPFEAPSLVLASVREGVEGLPAALKWPVVFVMVMIHDFHFGLLVLAYAVVRCGLGRWRQRTNAVDLLILLILVCCAAGFVLLPIQRGLVWNVSIHVYGLVYALLFALMGPVLCDVVRRLITCRPSIATAGACVLVLAVAANTYSLWRKALANTPHHCDVISSDLYACYRYVEASTPTDAVILQPRFVEGWPVAGAITQRRIVLEFEKEWQRHYFDTGPIVADLKTFYAGTDPMTARAILARYSVDYVIADCSGLARGEYTRFLTEVYRRNAVAVFRVERANSLAYGVWEGCDAPVAHLLQFEPDCQPARNRGDWIRTSDLVVPNHAL